MHGSASGYRCSTENTWAPPRRRTASATSRSGLTIRRTSRSTGRSGWGEASPVLRASTAPIAAKNVRRGTPTESAHPPISSVSSTSVSPTSKKTAASAMVTP